MSTLGQQQWCCHRRNDPRCSNDRDAVHARGGVQHQRRLKATSSSHGPLAHRHLAVVGRLRAIASGGLGRISDVGR